MLMIPCTRWPARALLAFSGVLSTGSFCSPALAQNSATRPENPEVEKLVSEAIALRAQGKDLAGLETLKKAAEIDPSSVRVQVHLANVYQALGQWLAADEYLRLAVAQANDPYVVRHRQLLHTRGQAGRSLCRSPTHRHCRSRLRAGGGAARALAHG
jgi:tetratricopeptide (TPR) repeat protein